MKIRRFYFKKEIKLAHIQGIHGILLTQLKWQLDKVTFVLYYPGETIEINNNIDEIAETLKKRGKPDCVQGSFKATVLDALAI